MAWRARPTAYKVNGGPILANVDLEKPSAPANANMGTSSHKVFMLQEQIRTILLPVIEECIVDLEKSTVDIHLSNYVERIGRVASSVAGVVATGLTMFPPTAVVGVPLLVGSAATGLGSSVGGFLHQKHMYTKAVEKVRKTLHDELTPILDETADLLIILQNEHNRRAELKNSNVNEPKPDSQEDEPQLLQEVQILSVRLKHIEIMWNPEADEKEKEEWMSEFADEEEDSDCNCNKSDGKKAGGGDWFGAFGQGASAAASAGAAAVKATILTGKALKAARAAAIRDAIQGFKAARAAGGVGGAAARASAVRGAVEGFKAAKATATTASRALAGVGAVLGVAALAWDSYELHTDSPSDLENDCKSRRDQLDELRKYLKEYCDNYEVD